MVGRKQADDTKRKRALSMVGHSVSIETRFKISRSNLGKLRSDSTKGKLSLSHTGNVHSDKTKHKMSECRKNLIMVDKDRIYASKYKQVTCSNGMIFKSLSEAVRWLVSLGHPISCKSDVAKAASGIRKRARGFIWTYGG